MHRHNQEFQRRTQTWVHSGDMRGGEHGRVTIAVAAALALLLILIVAVAASFAEGAGACGGDGFCTTSTAGTALTCSDYTVGKGQFDDCRLTLAGEKPQAGGFFSVTMGAGLSSSGGAGGQVSPSQPLDWVYDGDFACVSPGTKTIYVNWAQTPMPPGPELLNRSAVTITCT